MPPQQPLDKAPPFAVDDYLLAALNRLVSNSPDDASSRGNDGTPAGTYEWLRVGVSLDGVSGTIDYGDITNIQQVSMWLNPGSTTEQLFLVDAGAYVHLVGGVVTYQGLVAAATYVNGVAGTAVLAGEWSHVVCQFTQDDANNFELGTDGTNFGAIDVKDLRAMDDVWSAARVAEEYKQGVPDDDLVLWEYDGSRDLSRFGHILVPTVQAIVGHAIDLEGGNDYLREVVADWRPDDSIGTICAWIRRDVEDEADTIFSSADEGSTNRFLSFAVDGNNNLEVVQINADTADQVTGGTTLNSDLWYHVALVSNGAAYAMYVNGVVEDLTVASGANGGDWLAETANRDNIVLGALYHGTPGTYFEGHLRDVRVYSRALSVAELLTMYRRHRRAV